VVRLQHLLGGGKQTLARLCAFIQAHCPPEDRSPGLVFKAQAAGVHKELRLRGGQAKAVVHALREIFRPGSPFFEEIWGKQNKERFDDSLVSAFLHFMKWYNLVSFKTLSEAEVQKIEEIVQAWLPLHAERFDAHPYDHMPVHFGEDIREHGPIASLRYRLYQLELYNGISKAAWRAKRYTGS